MTSLNWEMVGALTTIAALINALGWFVIDMRIDQKLQKTADDIMDRINGKYLRTDLYDAKHSQLIVDIARKLDRAECIHRRQLADGPPSDH